MSDAQLHAEITALLEADTAAARRWSCDRPDCDGLPHEGCTITPAPRSACLKGTGRRG
ncbi:hypothetical protein [Streptomyces flaveus]|uniref:hypothetical protein n=1 Tax=Streptomyces flaveus TaxID=66370 RepID=UPI0033243E1D